MQQFADEKGVKYRETDDVAVDGRVVDHSHARYFRNSNKINKKDNNNSNSNIISRSFLEGRFSQHPNEQSICSTVKPLSGIGPQLLVVLSTVATAAASLLNEWQNLLGTSSKNVLQYSGNDLYSSASESSKALMRRSISIAEVCHLLNLFATLDPIGVNMLTAAEEADDGGGGAFSEQHSRSLQLLEIFCQSRKELMAAASTWLDSLSSLQHNNENPPCPQQVCWGCQHMKSKYYSRAWCK